jgi:hypothetical protein
MSKKPFFLTGANARIILNNRSVAYATDISYSVTVRHASPRVLGKFEVEVVQPLSYEVEGTLTIIKYAKGMKDHVGDAPNAANQAGNGLGAFDSDNGAIASALGLPSGGKFDGGTSENFNPQRMFQSKMFDIEIRQAIPPGGNTSVLQASLDFLNDALFPDGLNASNDTNILVRLRDCRFTALDFKLSKKGLPMQTMQFKARYADDDTYVAQKSGVGQELA